jgi:penicillin-binding protein A
MKFERFRTSQPARHRSTSFHGSRMIRSDYEREEGMLEQHRNNVDTKSRKYFYESLLFVVIFFLTFLFSVKIISSRFSANDFDEYARASYRDESGKEGSRQQENLIAASVKKTLSKKLLGRDTLVGRNAISETASHFESSPHQSTDLGHDGSVTSLALQKLPPLEQVNVYYNQDKDTAFTEKIPLFNSRFAGRVAALTQKNEFVFFTLQFEMQNFVESLMRSVRAEHAAIVAMEVSSGRVLAIAGRSPLLPAPEFHNGYPAASLFKVVTAAAGIERASLTSDSLIRYRGGTYQLSRQNYFPSSGKDRKVMSVGEALGKSCNPVFGRIALNYINANILRFYASSFGFNHDVRSDVPLPKSIAYIPEDDPFELSRTGAGFGGVTISPVHAATLMAGIANEGYMNKPTFIDRIVAPTGVVVYKGKPRKISTMVKKNTSLELLRMMRFTVTHGTSKREFMRRNKSVLSQMSIAAKTGTLSGDNPRGLNNWFIATAPLERPEIAIAVVTVNASAASSKASHLGRMVLEKYFQ